MLRFVAVFALTGAMAQAQVDRTFRLQSPVTEKDFQDLSVAALTVAGLKARAADFAARELSISGTVEQVRIAEWAIAELDRPAPSIAASTILTLEGKDPDNTLRVFYPRSIASDQALMEAVTAVRTISDIRYAGVYTSHRAIIVRGNREQVDLVDWLLPEMHRDAPGEAYLYPRQGNTPPRPGDDENRVRVFRYTRAADVQQFNEVQTMIRTITDTRRVYPYIGRRAIVLRGSEEQLDMTAWILAQIEKDLPQAAKSMTGDYTMKSGEVARMFHFSGATSVQAFNETSTAIRAATGIRRVFPFASARTMAVRATPAQVSQAAAMATQ